MTKVDKIVAYAKSFSQSQIFIDCDKNKCRAIQTAQNFASLSVFTNSSGRNDLVGIDIAWNDLPLENILNTISNLLCLTNFLAELAVIEKALVEYWAAILTKTISPNNVTIFTDSQYVLQALL